jgi:hypothetical protein
MEQNIRRNDTEQSEPFAECEFCGGTGIIVTDESDGEGHMQKGVGEQKCICKKNEDE